jgi:hypothetical protein
MKFRRKQKVSVFDRSIEEMRDAFNTRTKRELQYELDLKMDKEWKDENDKILNTPLLHLDDPDHEKPVTRRDFLSRGLIATSASVLIPSIPSMLYGQSVCPPSASGLNHIPFFTLDAAGGMQMAGTNAGVGANNNPNNMLSSLTTFGVQTVPTAWNMDIGLAMHPQSYVLEGIKTAASAAALAKTSGFIIACASGDDTSNNPQNISQAIAEGGFIGELASTIGTSTDESGGNSVSNKIVPAFRSTRVQSPAAAQALNQPGILLTGLNNNQNAANLVVEKVAQITALQATKLNPGAVSTKTKDVIICGANKNVENFKAAAVNPGADATITSIFPAVNGGNTVDAAVGTAAFLALAGKVGPATVEFGGRDYHNNNNQRQRDNEVGRSIGQLIEYANQLNQPLVIHFFTDGSTSANGNPDTQGIFFQPANDNGNCSATFVIAFDPNGRVPVVKPQLGSYGTNGVVANSTPWSNTPAVAARIVAANYFYLMNQMATFNKIYPSPGFTVNDVIAFGRPIK